MNDSLASTLVLCDLDNLLLGEDGNLTQVVRDVLQLFSSRGGRLTVFSQRSPRAVRSILGSVRLAAPALVCGGTMAYHYADGNRVPLCSFAQQQELFNCLPDTPGVGVAVQMQDGTTRVLRMSNALERHLRQEWTPYLLANAADIHPEQVLRVLLYQDSKSVPLISLAEKAIGDRVALLGERIAPDTLVLTPNRISGREMLTPSAPWRRWVQSRFWCWLAVSPCWSWCRLWSTALLPPMPRQSCALPPGRSP